LKGGAEVQNHGKAEPRSFFGGGKLGEVKDPLQWLRKHDLNHGDFKVIACARTTARETAAVS